MKIAATTLEKLKRKKARYNNIWCKISMQQKIQYEEKFSNKSLTLSKPDILLVTYGRYAA